MICRDLKRFFFSPRWQQWPQPGTQNSKNQHLFPIFCSFFPFFLTLSHPSFPLTGTVLFNECSIQRALAGAAPWALRDRGGWPEGQRDRSPCHPRGEANRSSRAVSSPWICRGLWDIYPPITLGSLPIPAPTFLHFLISPSQSLSQPVSQLRNISGLAL